MVGQKKQAVLAVSFGTSHEETRKKTLDVIEQEIREAFGEYEFFRAYTSPTIIRILRERDQIIATGVQETLERLLLDGYEKVLVQPTHVIRGFEYDRIKEILERYRGRFDRLMWGEPLLAEERDYREVVQILGQELDRYRGSGTELVLLGHGTEHAANISYEKLQQTFFDYDFRDISIGTVEASMTLENMAARMEKRQSQRVVLVPFLVVAGEHVCRDMAGEGADSWKSRFLEKGYEVDCVMKGLGEYAGIRRMYVRHAKEAERKMG